MVRHGCLYLTRWNDEQARRKYVRQALGDHLVWAYALLFHGFAWVEYGPVAAE